MAQLGVAGTQTPFGNPVEIAGSIGNSYPVPNRKAQEYLAEQEKAQQTQDFSLERAFYDYQQELIKGNQSGAFQILNTLIQQGKLSPEQAELAQSRYGDAMATLNQAIGGAGRMANEGLYTDRERGEFLSRMNPAYEQARELGKTGGVSDADWGNLMSGYDENRGRIGAVADRGALTEGEYEQNLAASQQGVMDQYRNAAASTYNAANLGGSPLAASAIMAKGARDAGANRASVKADLDRYQADTRMKGMDALTQLLNSQGSQQLGRGQNMISGTGQQASIAGQFADFLNQDAQGRATGINALGGLANQQSGIAKDLAGIDMQTDNGNTPYSNVIDSMMNSLNNTAQVNKNKKGNAVAKTPYGKVKPAETSVTSPKAKDNKANVHVGRVGA